MGYMLYRDGEPVDRGDTWGEAYAIGLCVQADFMVDEATGEVVWDFS